MPDNLRSFPDVASVTMALTPSYPVYCVRPRVIARTARRFIERFPGTLLYAVKCNPHRLILDALYEAGIRHFDTASLPEIAQVAEGYPDAKAYFMHPVKGRAAIRASYRIYGVRHFVVDHGHELDKILDELPAHELVIIVRLATPPADDTLYHLAAKFGIAPGPGAALLREAVRRGCRAGVAFHVGSQCRNPAAYPAALSIVGKVLADAGVEPACIDVGGGFPAYYANMSVPPLDDFMAAIRAGLAGLGLGPEVAILAEPGRALVAGGCSLLTQILLRKDDQLYVNDGIYGSLAELQQVRIEPPARLIRIAGAVSAKLAGFTLNGPTCDSLDVMPARFSLPEDAREGDWIEIDQMGAYSNALATHFNGFYPETFVKVYDDPPAEGS